MKYRSSILSLLSEKPSTPPLHVMSVASIWMTKL